MNQNNTYFLKHTFLFLSIFTVLIVLSFFFFDKPVAWFFHDNDLSTNKSLTYLTELFSPMCNLVIWPVIYCIFKFWKKNRKVSTWALLISLSIACSNFLGSGGKIFFGRSRPEMLFLYNDYGFHLFSFQDMNFSFPSGHACTIGAITGVFCCLLPRYTFFIFFFGFLFSFIRVMQNFHYLSDILSGLLLGVVVAQFLYLQMKSHKSEFNL